LQVLSNMVDYGMEPQAALDAPRWRLDGVDSAIGPASVNDVTYALMPCYVYVEFALMSL
jgi:gamma-glutamyltranspeptidase / glutathione hydrolase